MGKYDFKKGDKVKYQIPYEGDEVEYVHCEVREEPEECNFPSIELNNGHTARWDGKRYLIEDMKEVELIKSI